MERPRRDIPESRGDRGPTSSGAGADAGAGASASAGAGEGGDGNGGGGAAAFGPRTHTKGEPMDQATRSANLRTIEDMFYHGYDAYMEHAYPEGELTPLSCGGQRFDLSKVSE